MTNVVNVNDHLGLICGESGTGKSASLMNLKNPQNWMYLNCESGKKLPFKTTMQQFTITDPYQVYEAFTHAETDPSIEGIIIDSVTYLMDMFESIHVLPSTNTMQAWGQYAQFYKNLMQIYVAKSTKNVFFTGHTLTELDEEAMAYKTKVPIKGSLKNQGIESYFSVVVATKKMKLKELEPYSSRLLNITPEEEMLGYKHVFQTRLTKETVGERIRGPLGMWATEETFIDNNLQSLMQRLHEYYGEELAA
jgi:hypothetical protein